MTIDGKGVEGSEKLSVINPATGKSFIEVPDCTREELDRAVAAARSAFPAWKALSYSARRDALLAIAAVLEEHGDEIAELIVQEQGKPFSAAQGEIRSGLRWSRGTAALELPVRIAEDSAERRVEVHRVPIGVVGAIAPWNFPIVQACWKILPALLAGNTVVLKPSPFTPVATLRLGELLQGVLPAGVLNVVSGGDRLGPWMTEHPDIDKISFTGSTATGKLVMRSAAGTLKRLTLELGGNDAAIVMEDADITKAVEGLAWGAMRNAGQICSATKRIYVHDSVYDHFARAFAVRVAGVRFDRADVAGAEVGPVQNRTQFERVSAIIEDSRAEGHGFLLGEAEASSDAGYLIKPAIIDCPPDDSRIVVEEQFGPVVPLLRFTDLDDVLKRVNATQYGLGVSIWSADLAKARELSLAIDCGTAWINETQYVSPDFPFGGHKQSGLGVENGIEGLLAYTQTQTLVLRRG
jgi:aldehyde dehydrogenase (NAD+)